MAAGSWFNLPEFGISEKLGGNTDSLYRTSSNTGGIIARPVTGGSIGNTTYGTVGSVAGASNFRPQEQPLREGPILEGGVTAGGSTGGSSAPTPTATDNIDNDFLKAIDAQYSGTQNYLNSAEQNLRSQLPGIESDIRSLVDQSRSQLDVQNAQGSQQLQQQQVEGEQRKEDALSAARRLYNELLRGGQQRYGGASSAGEAFRTLGANEFQRNQGQIQQDFGNFMAQVEGERTNLRNQYQAAQQSLDAQELRMVNEARRDFQNKLQEIAMARGQAEDAKANMRLSALQDLRNQMYQIKLARAQEQQNLDGLLTQNEQLLQSYIQSATSANQNFASGTDLNPETGLTMGSGGTDNPAMIGFRTNNDEDLLTGSILRPRQNDLLA